MKIQITIEDIEEVEVEDLLTSYTMFNLVYGGGVYLNKEKGITITNVFEELDKNKPTSILHPVEEMTLEEAKNRFK